MFWIIYFFPLFLFTDLVLSAQKLIELMPEIPALSIRQWLHVRADHLPRVIQEEPSQHENCLGCLLPCPSTVLSIWPSSSHLIFSVTFWVMYLMISFFRSENWSLGSIVCPQTIQLVNRRAGTESQEVGLQAWVVFHCAHWNGWWGGGNWAPGGGAWWSQVACPAEGTQA